MKLSIALLAGIMELLERLVVGQQISLDNIPAQVFWSQMERFPMYWQGFSRDLDNTIYIFMPSDVISQGKIIIAANTAVGSYTYKGPASGSNPTMQNFVLTTTVDLIVPIEFWCGNIDGSLYSYRTGRYDVNALEVELPDLQDTQGCYWRLNDCSEPDPGELYCGGSCANCASSRP